MARQSDEKAEQMIHFLENLRVFDQFVHFLFDVLILDVI